MTATNITNTLTDLLAGMGLTCRQGMRVRRESRNRTALTPRIARASWMS